MKISALCLIAFIAQLAATCFLVWAGHPWWALGVMVCVRFTPCGCPKKEAK